MLACKFFNKNLGFINYFTIFAFKNISYRIRMTAFKRSTYLDLIKGFAISLVVFAHCIQWGSGISFYNSKLFFQDPLFKFIYGFHMPLFMIISGYLFRNSLLRHHLVDVIKSKAQTILLPLISWQTLYLLFLILIKDIQFSPYLVYTYIGTLWFLRSIILCCIIVIIGKYIFKDSVFFYITFIASSLFIPEHLIDGIHIFMMPFFIIGYKWRAYKLDVNYKKRETKTKLTYFLLSTIFYLLFFYLYDKPNFSIYINGTCLIRNDHFLVSQLIIDILRFVYALIGISMVMIGIDIIKEKICNSFISTLLIRLGNNTLGIYIINYYTTKSLLNINSPSHFLYTLTTIEFLVMIGFSYIIIRLIHNNRILDYMLLGSSNKNIRIGYEKNNRKRIQTD